MTTNWIYNGVELIEIPSGVIGFVYLITNIKNGKMYVGKKGITSTRRVKNRNSSRRKIIKVDSNYRDYYGSNSLLLADVENMGKHNFRREILHFCKTKAEMAYLEIKEQINRKVLFDESYYNNFIGCRIHSKHFKGWIDDN